MSSVTNGYSVISSCIINEIKMARVPGEITLLLDRLSAGDRSAEEALMPSVYLELHRLASARMRGERPGHTIQPTALVHEAYLRLCNSREVKWEDRGHFFRAAGCMMRRILVDYARQHRARKRNDGARPILLDEAVAISPDQFAMAIEVDDVLRKLAELSPRQAKVVEMRFFAGLTEEEIAEALSVTVRTIKRDWMVARAWLHQRLRRV
jgi:RNA polymerase sigma-70 factor, ECF subfamily